MGPNMYFIFVTYFSSYFVSFLGMWRVSFGFACGGYPNYDTLIDLNLRSMWGSIDQSIYIMHVLKLDTYLKQLS